MQRYKDIATLKINQNRQDRLGIEFKKTVTYPYIPPTDRDIYVITTQGDRYDILAQKYYNDSTLWWIIPIANDILEKNSLYPPLGIQLRIPTNINEVLAKYIEINNLR
jgi:chitinase